MTLSAHTNYVMCLAVLNNGELASGSYDRNIIIWDWHNGRLIRTLIGHTAVVHDLSVLPNGNLASCGWDRAIIIWNTTSGRQVLKFNSTHVIHTIVAFKNGNLAGSVYYQKHIFIWDTETGNLVKKIAATKYHVNKLLLLDNGLLVSAGRDNKIRIGLQSGCLAPPAPSFDPFKQKYKPKY